MFHIFKILKSLHIPGIYATCFDQHWSSSGVSQTVGETAVLSPVSSIVRVGPGLCSHMFYGDGLVALVHSFMHSIQFNFIHVP
jgi:hypothetical protein